MKKIILLSCFWWLLTMNLIYGQREFLHADSLAIATNGCAYSGPSPMQMRMQADKMSALKLIRINSFNLLEQYIAEESYVYSTTYTYLRIGNFFDEQKQHALLVYISDALVESNNDYRVNVHLFEIKNGKAEETFFAQNVSAGFESVASTVTDFDLDGQNELVIYTTEPEWYLGERPMNDYYHLYNYQNNKLVKVENFETFPNPSYLQPNFVSAFKTCGCDGDCWIDMLYHQKDNSFEPIATFETSCSRISTAYKIEGTQKIAVADTYIADGRTTANTFWITFLKKFPQYSH
ncbi:MAG TPA: hypothetical protein PK230_03970 [Chitinophagales bacterium]|nr:hypothetical protein [Chitinophagales bacterium]